MRLVRRHLVVAAALVLALATGVALGAGPLSHEALLPSSAEPAPRPAEQQPDATADELAEAAAPRVLAGKLADRPVALLATPGVDPAVLDALTDDVAAAQGAVVSRWRAGESLVSAREKALVDTLGSQLLEQLRDSRIADPEASAYERMGQLVGTAIASRGKQGAPPERDVLTIRQSIDAASLLSTDADEARVAPLVLVVLGDDLDDHVAADLLAGIAARASGVVVAAGERDGDLAVLDGLGTVTTVDGVTGAAGRLGAVLALARAEKRPGGSYGASGSDGLLPLG
jgi:hypothetical protein